MSAAWAPIVLVVIPVLGGVAWRLLNKPAPTQPPGRRSAARPDRSAAAAAGARPPLHDHAKDPEPSWWSTLDDITSLPETREPGP